jgi:D-alanine-D-alanine ligase
VYLHPGGGLLGCDVVFPALHGPHGEDGTVQGLLEVLDVPYVGAGVLASSLCMNKAAFKDVLTASRVPQVRYSVVREAWWRSAPREVEARVSDLRSPLFVKPARLGSSVGTVRVADMTRLNDALEMAFTCCGTAVIEEHSPGAAVECAVIGLTDLEVSVPGQVVKSNGDRHDYRTNGTRRACALATPAEISTSAASEVQRLACDTFVRVGCAGLARVDFFVEGERVLVDEVNTIPGFGPRNEFPKLWEASGVMLPDLCDRLLRYALERFRTERCRGVL